jgi:8-oxo-dGTP pyrophosphatase MutT (NUDIX family)
VYIGARVLRANTIKEIGDLASKDNIVCSGALFYAKTTRRFLLLQKTQGKHHGSWGLVGGTTESEETPWQGLLREIQEEIGAVPEILKTIPIETFVSNDKVFNFHTYLCIIEKEFIPTLSSEHSGWAWSTLDYAPKPLHQGLRNSFSNRIIRTKLQTIFDIIELI